MENNSNQENNAPSPMQKRQTAYKIDIISILKGQFVKGEGWNPSYVTDKSQRTIARVNVIATVVSSIEMAGTSKSIIIDDGTAKIPLRTFENSAFDISTLEIGEIILIIGRIREYNEKKYIIPEIVKKITDKAWIEVRKKELEMLKSAGPAAPKETELPEDKQKEPKQGFMKAEEPVEDYPDDDKKESPAEKVYSLIKDCDSGEGALTQEVIEKSSIPDAERIITTLLEEGDIFELSPGKLKVLE